MAPVFSLDIKVGDKVNLIYRNRKGEVLYQGQGFVDANYGQRLVIDIDPTGETTNHILFVQAKDVYYGKHSMEYFGGYLNE